MEAIFKKATAEELRCAGTQNAARGDLLAHWRHRIRHWWSMFTGTSYYHQPQNIGRVFTPGKLEGYFNDLSGKTNWKGNVAPNGLPVSELSNGKVIHFPILLCQKALGHWDLWRMNAGSEHRESFLKIAGWLLDGQDPSGGWDTWALMDRPMRYRYSAMTQGEALSVMVRAHALTDDGGFERACRRALALMRQPVQEEGVCCYEGQDAFLEEFPSEERDTVLNGWIFALFGIHDYLLRFPDEQARAFYARCHRSLIRSLADFDAGYWSYYSSGTRRLASPFYHRLHLSQLEALRLVADEHILEATQSRWAMYERRGLNRARAVVRKGIQKLREARETTVVG